MADTSRRENVLVVDDEPQILSAITDLLEDDFVVWTAGDAEAALAILGRQDVAVILSDQRMPGISGAEFLSRARDISDATRVLITGYSDLDALVTAVNLGQIHAYLSKPWNPLELRVVIRTAADRWRLERTLQQERTLLHSLMNNIPDAIFFKDRALNFTRVNTTQAALLGLKLPGELIGHCLSDMRPGEHATAVEERERALLAKGEPQIDKEEATKDPFSDQVIWHSITKVPIRQGEEITGLVGIARDITKRKQAEDYLRRGHEELQKAVEERTHWLREEIRRRTAAEEQARAALESAEAASRAKTIFLANMSHELRTPLNAIIGFSELAATMMDAPELEKYGAFLGNIGESAHHLLRVINDILDVSRIEVGRVTLHESEVDIGEVIQCSLRLVGHVAASKGQTLAFSIADNFPRLRGDERLLKQALLNIVSNATKFTPEAGHISVKAEQGDRGITIIVEDDGVGIAASDIPVVLLPFGQVENAMQRRYDGTGLGLPLTKGFMELHGGRLSLESEIGKGTRVTLTFPPERTLAPPISA